MKFHRSIQKARFCPLCGVSCGTYPIHVLTSRYTIWSAEKNLYNDVPNFKIRKPNFQVIQRFTLVLQYIICIGIVFLSMWYYQQYCVIDVRYHNEGMRYHNIAMWYRYTILWYCYTILWYWYAILWYWCAILWYWYVILWYGMQYCAENSCDKVAKWKLFWGRKITRFGCDFTAQFGGNFSAQKIA